MLFSYNKTVYSIIHRPLCTFSLLEEKNCTKRETGKGARKPSVPSDEPEQSSDGELYGESKEVVHSLLPCCGARKQAIVPQNRSGTACLPEKRQSRFSEEYALACVFRPLPLEQTGDCPAKPLGNCLFARKQAINAVFPKFILLPRQRGGGFAPLRAPNRAICRPCGTARYISRLRRKIRYIA